MIGSELGYAGSEHVANSNVANSTSSETGVNPSFTRGFFFFNRAAEGVCGSSFTRGGFFFF